MPRIRGRAARRSGHAAVSWVRKAPSGRWQARWRDLQGVEQVKTFTRKSDAEGFLATVETQKRAGTYIDPHLAEQPFGTYCEAFLASHAVAPSTRALYELEARRYLLPAFDRTPIGAIRPESIRILMRELQDRGVGARTIQVVHQVLSRILHQALDDGLIAMNAASLARPPKRPERGAIRILTEDELATLADAIDPRYRAVVLLAGYGGLRFGEVAGLRIPQLRLLERKVDVVEGMIELRGKVEPGPLKTKGSRRTIAIPAFLVDELAAHVGAWRDPTGSDLVFSAERGGPLRRTNWRRRVWAPAVEAAKLDPAPTFHHLRHTAAAIAIAKGAHPKALQARLGHASIKTTLDLYGGLFPSLDEDLAERLDASYRDVAARRTQSSGVASDVAVGDARAARVRHAGDDDVIPIDRAGA